WIRTRAASRLRRRARAGPRRRLARGARAPAPARALAAAGIDRRGRPAHGPLALPGDGARGLVGLAVRHPGVRRWPRRLYPALGRDRRGVVPAVPVAVRDDRGAVAAQGVRGRAGDGGDVPVAAALVSVWHELLRVRLRDAAAAQRPVAGAL